MNGSRMPYLLINPNDRDTEYGSADVYYVIDHLPLGRGIEVLEDIKKSNPSALFVFESYLAMEGYEDSSIFAGEFLIGMAQEYLRELPDHSLNFSNKTVPFNCLMKNNRFSRIWASCWLMNNQYGRTDFIYSQPWDINASLISYIESHKKARNIDLRPELLPAKWHHHGTNNFVNFFEGTNAARIFKEALLRPIFDPSILSIVLEPVEGEPGCMITEKYINAIYGATIPIMGGYMIYDLLERLGFDTFPDIVDTSSQSIKDPALRVIKMLEDNRHLFDNHAHLMDDPIIQKRLMNNLDLIRNVDRLFDNIISLSKPQNIERYGAACSQHRFKFRKFNGLLNKKQLNYRAKNL